METILQQLARLTPGKLLVSFWACAIALAALSSVKALEGVSLAAMLLMFSGYPYAIILGMPRGIVRPALRNWSKPWLLVLLCAAALIVVLAPFAPDEGYQPTVPPTTLRQWLETALALVVNISLFSPFFVGAAALNDTRRATNQSATLESIPNFIALFAWPYGGALHVHRRVRAALHVA